MKVLFSIAIGVLCLGYGFAQAPDDEETGPVAVEEITLAKDDGAGKPGSVVDEFLTTDKPIHCRVQLKGYAPTMVKMQMTAAGVQGLKPGTKVANVSYKTNGKQNIVNFHVSPATAWLAGKYDIQILLDNKPDGTKEFEIKEAKTKNDSKPRPAPAKKTKKKT